MRTVLVFLCLCGMAGVLPAANILTNSSFEEWMIGMPVGWLSSELLYPGSAVQDSSSHTGTYCVKLTATDTVAFITTAALVTPGRSYDFTGYARVPGAVGGSFILEFLNSQGDTLGLPTLVPVYYSDTVYNKYTTWVTAPDSAAGVSVSFATLIGLQAYIDDVTLDDTASGGIMESPARPHAAEPHAHKVLTVAGSQGHTAVSAPLFDVMGRRVAGRPGSGVYFVRTRD